MSLSFQDNNMATFSKKSEQQWQAESDAHTMATYQEILEDKPRLRRAMAAAKKQATDLNKRASAMQKAAGAGRRGK